MIRLREAPGRSAAVFLKVIQTRPGPNSICQLPSLIFLHSVEKQMGRFISKIQIISAKLSIILLENLLWNMFYAHI